MSSELKHGFLIIAHSYLDLLSKIIDCLTYPNHYFFINIDRKTPCAVVFMRQYEGRDDIFFLKGKERMYVSHCGYTLVECTLRLLHLAMDNGMDYYHLISGQDFPCRSNEEFDRFFLKNQGQSYMRLDSEAYRRECLKKKYPSRIKPWYFYDIPHRDWRLVNFTVRSLNYVSKRVWWRRDIPNLWGGWQWFSWYRTVADYVVNEEKANPAFFARFHYTSCSDELVFATLLHDQSRHLNLITNNSLRYVNWDKMALGRKLKNAPLLLNEEEYSEIIDSGAFFCRKVHPVISEKLILMLEDHVKMDNNKKFNSV